MKKECLHQHCRRKPVYTLRITNHKNQRVTLAHYCPRHAREIKEFLRLADQGNNYWKKRKKTIKKDNQINQ